MVAEAPVVVLHREHVAEETLTHQPGLHLLDGKKMVLLRDLDRQALLGGELHDRIALAEPRGKRSFEVQRNAEIERT